MEKIEHKTEMVYVRTMNATFDKNGTKINRKDRKNFVQDFITMDETWAYHHNPVSKQKVEEWSGAESSASK